MRGLPGPIMQNGFVVRDLEAAVHFWAETFGVGPEDRIPQLTGFAN